MNIELAKSAGFCFGVKRVIDMIYLALDSGQKICTLGNIIHNKNMLDELAKKGVRVINNVDEALKNETIIIRSHGVSFDVYNELSDKKFLDGTCKFVKKIHNIVSTCFIDPITKNVVDKNKILVIIIGDKNHPEVKGIVGHCIYDFKIIADLRELNEYLKSDSNDNLKSKYVKVVMQTTFKVEEAERCIEVIKSYFKNYEIFDTICNETKRRQIEAGNMSKNKDLMIIVGDKNSSNTQKLVNVCKQNCETFLIENKFDINKYDITKYNNIGMSAGASTPTNIIMDVIEAIKSNFKVME